jgi:hypothetical protein
MPRCSRVVGLLVDYLERRLPPDVQADLERHLSRCASCVAQLKTYRSTLSLLQSLREEDLPIELRTSLYAFLGARTLH